MRAWCEQFEGIRRTSTGWVGFVILAMLAVGLGACAKNSAGGETKGEPAAGTIVPKAYAGSQLPGDYSEQTRECITCHRKESLSIVEQWGASRHYRAKVGCFECHQAHPGDPDAFMHFNQRIAVIVSPKDCAKCHSKEVDEFTSSHHAQAAKILGSEDNVLAEVVEGTTLFKTPAFPQGVAAIAVNGCWQCHGSEVKVDKDGRLDAATWPNTGIGRLNPDGSRGSCSACHSRHQFSVALA